MAQDAGEAQNGENTASVAQNGENTASVAQKGDNTASVAKNGGNTSGLSGGMKAMLWGALLGIPLGLCNLVVGLKLGLGVGVALSAVGFAGVLRRTPLLPELSPPDAALLQSVASAAGYSSGSAVASVLAAVTLAGAPLSLPVALGWTLTVALFGTGLGWVWREKALALPFPSATAAAEAIKALWTDRAPGKTVGHPTRVWVGTTLGSTAVTLARHVPRGLPSTAFSAGSFGLGLEVSPLALGIGALLGLRLALTVAGAGLVVALVEGPRLAAAGLLQQSDLGGLAAWNVWPATALISGSAMTHLLLGLRSGGSLDARALRALQWSVLPGLALGVICVVGFGAPWWAALTAVVLTPVACIVSIRMTGETDVTPGAPLAMGLQLLFGAFVPFSPGVHLASAGVLAGTSASAADLVSDVKTGALVGLEPRRQLVAQLLGCVVGACVAAPAFLMLSRSGLGVPPWPAPAGQVFLAAGKVAAAAAGLSSDLRVACVVALLVGVVLAVIERASPATRFPSPTGIGLAMLVPPSMAITIGLGAVLAHLLRGRDDLKPLASGLMVGETTGEILAAIEAAIQ